MFITHDEVKQFVAEHLEELTNWSLLEVESPFFQGKRVDLLAHDGASFVVIEIKLNVSKSDIEQVMEYVRCASQEQQDIRVVLFGTSFSNIVYVPDGIELWRTMMSLNYEIHRGIPHYRINELSVAPYNSRTRRVDDRFIVSSKHKTAQPQSNPFLRSRKEIARPPFS